MEKQKAHIVSITKRPWWDLHIDVDDWKVVVEFEDGKRKSYNCWAGVDSPDKDNLLWSLEKRLRGENFEQLIGTSV